MILENMYVNISVQSTEVLSNEVQVVEMILK